MQIIKACMKFIAFMLLCLVIVPTQTLILLITKGKFSYILPYVWHKAVCAIFGIKVHLRGEPCQNQQVLFVCNHISYLDIPVFASKVNDVSFLAKSDVEKWPVFGYLSKLQQTAFISRSRKDAGKEAGKLDSLFSSDKNLVLFAEGTSTDGTSVLPFKSSLFKIVMTQQHSHIQIQPVTISMIKIDDDPPDHQDTRNLYSWHRDMDTPLHEHLWLFAKTKGAEIEILFHPLLAARDYSDRKILASDCHEIIKQGLEISCRA